MTPRALSHPGPGIWGAEDRPAARTAVRAAGRLGAAAVFAACAAACLAADPAAAPASGAAEAWACTPVPTGTGCGFSEVFSDPSSLSNFRFFDAATQMPGTAEEYGFSTQAGGLECSGPGGMAQLDGAVGVGGDGDATVEADFEMDRVTDGQGLFGIAFRTASTGSYYCFEWNPGFANGNGGIPDWEVERNSGALLQSVACIKSGRSRPAYVRGTWVRLKVVEQGPVFQCSVNLGDCGGDRLVYRVVDTTYSSGGSGFRLAGIVRPNVARIRRFNVAWACTPTPTPSASPSQTATVTVSPSVTPPETATPSATRTPSETVTPSDSETPTRTPAPSETATPAAQDQAHP
jgi:hypothetical protein